MIGRDLIPVLAVLLGPSIACDGDGPTPSSDAFRVSGTWLQTGIIIEDSCGLQLLGVAGVFTISQSGDRLTLRFPSTVRFPTGRVVTGQIDTGTGAFTVPEVVIAGELPLGTQTGRFTSNEAYTAESTVSFTDGGRSCVVRSRDQGVRQSGIPRPLLSNRDPSRTLRAR